MNARRPETSHAAPDADETGVPPAKASDSRVLIHYRWPLTFLLVTLLLVAGGLAALWMMKDSYSDTVEEGREVIETAARAATVIAERFQRGNITETFRAAIPEISSSGMGRLEVAMSRQTEVFRMENEKTLFWDRLSLGRTISEIRVPVTYRYYVRLSDPWQLDVSGQSCIVYAPKVWPSLPPAIHTHQMEKWSDAGWARFNADEQLKDLELSITPRLVIYARDPQHLQLVRDQCRRTIAEFVRNWLLKEDHWREDRFHSIKVLFPDERAIDGQALEPTLELDLSTDR